MARPGFKPGWGRQPLPGRFDSCCLPPFRAAVRSWEIAEYFRASSVKIRSNDDIFVRQINGEIYVQEQDLKEQYESFQKLSAEGKRPCRCEPIPTLANDKTTYLAEKAIPARA